VTIATNSAINPRESLSLQLHTLICWTFLEYLLLLKVDHYWKTRSGTTTTNKNLDDSGRTSYLASFIGQMDFAGFLNGRLRMLNISSGCI
jgi:hypothetical protein